MEQRNTTCRNVIIDFYRLFFTAIICLWHFGLVKPMVNHGYICVEFFFILSGMLLCRSFLRQKIGTFQYTLKRIRNILPKVWIVFIPCIIIHYEYWIPKNISIDEILRTTNIFTNELLSIDSFGIFGIRINHTLWFLSILLLCGNLLYSALSSNYKLFVSIIAPLIVITLYSSLLASGNGNIEEGRIGEWLPAEFARGTAGLSLGIVLYHTIYAHKSDVERYLSPIKKAAIAVCLLLFILYLFSDSANDGFIIFLFIVLLLMAFISNNSESSSSKIYSAICWGGKHTLDIYIVHYPIVRLFVFINNRIEINILVLIALFFITTFVSAYFLYEANKRILLKS